MADCADYPVSKTQLKQHFRQVRRQADNPLCRSIQPEPLPGIISYFDDKSVSLACVTPGARGVIEMLSRAAAGP